MVDSSVDLFNFRIPNIVPSCLISRICILILVIAAAYLPARAQDCTPDRFGKLKELSLGPLSFKLKGSIFIPSGGKIRDFSCFVDFSWTASEGTFSYRKDQFTVVEGRVTNFRLKGEISDKELNIRPNGLEITLITSRPLKANAYGGVVSLAAKEEVLILDTRPVSISKSADGKISQAGVFQIKTSNKLAWQGAIFNFPQLPDPIKLDLTSERGTTLDKEFELPLDTGDIRITHANFSFSLPTSVTAKTFTLKSSNYRAVVSQINLSDLSADLQRDSLTLLIQGLSGSGEFTGKVVKSSPLPVLFTGKASLAKLMGTAPFSQTAATIQGIKITGLHLQPASTTTQNTVPHNSSNGQVKIGVRQPRGGVDSAIIGFQPLVAESLNPQTPTPPSLKPADFYTPSSGQLDAMKEMGITPLSEQQRAAISSSRTALMGMVNPNFLINYPEKDFKALLEQHIKKIKIPGNNFKLKLLDLKFGRQELLLLVGFENGPTSLGQDDSMKFVYRVSPAIEKQVNPGTNKAEQVLVLRYQLGLARFDQTDLSNTLALEDITGAVDDQVGQADSATQAPTPLSITLPLDIAQPFDLNNSFNDPATKTAITVTSKNVQAMISILSSVLLIDEQGIHLMGVLEAK